MSLPPRELCVGIAISLVGAVSFAAAAASSRLSGSVLSVICWLLVTAGVAGTLLAGRGSARGWLLLVTLQPVWMVYAVATDQQGFVLGAVASCAAQLSGYARSRQRGCWTGGVARARRQSARKAAAGAMSPCNANVTAV